MFDYNDIRFNIGFAVDTIRKTNTYTLMKSSLETFYIDFDDDEFLLVLAEMYKLVNRNALIGWINKDNTTSTKVVSMSEVYKSNDLTKYMKRIEDLGFFVYHYDKPNSTITVATSIDNIDNPKLDIIFPDLKVERVALTPYNYREMLDKYYTDPSKRANLDRMRRPRLVMLRLIAECYIRRGTDIRFYAYKTSDSQKNLYGCKIRVGNSLYPMNLFDIDEKLNEEMVEDLLKYYSMIDPSQLSSASGDGVTFSVTDPFGIGDLTLRPQFNKSVAGYSGNVRIVGVKSLTESVESLGFDEEVNEVVHSMTRVENGLCLVTGPQRSGKSTTLMSIFNQIVKKPISVAEFSSPVESPLLLDAYEYNSEKQLLGLTASAKKLDLDVALLNEIARASTASGVYDLLNSSVGVFSTFHINRIWHLPYKLEEYFGDKIINVITYLRYVLNQKALILQCPHCLETEIVEGSKELYSEVKDICKELGITSYKKAVGCDFCNNTGVRVGIQPFVEYIKFDDKLRSDLAKCTRVYDMEMVIKEHVKVNNCSLEFFMKRALMNGSIHPNQLLALL